MEQAYIFVNSEPTRLWDVARAASNIRGVLRADTVTGEYDIIILSELEDMSQLSKLIQELQSVDGVLRTHTCIVIPPYDALRGVL